MTTQGILTRVRGRWRDLDGWALLGKLRKIAAPVAFGGLVYLVALIVVFPYQRAAEYAEVLMANMGYDLSIGKAGPTFGIGVHLEDVRVATMPKDGSKPMEVVIDSARVTTNPLTNLRGGLAYDVSAQAFGGEVDVGIKATREKGSGQIAMREVALAKLPGVADKVGLPVKGQLDLDVDLSLEKLKMAAAQGEITWTCQSCEIGDGKAKLKVESHTLLRDGIAVPRLRLGKLVGKVVVDKGLGQIQRMEAKSPDIELVVEGEIRLADPFDASYLDVYVRFKLADNLLENEEKLQLMLQFIGDGKREDGFYGFRLSGPLRQLQDPQWMKNSPFPAGGRRPPVPGGLKPRTPPVPG